MENRAVVVDWAGLWQELQAAFDSLQETALSLIFGPWGLLQLAIILGLLLLAWLTGWALGPRLARALGGADQRQPWVRALAALLAHLRLLVFVAGGWIAVLAIRALTWPSRSYAIGVVVSIASIWLAMSLIGKLVRNPLAARLLIYTVWIVAALQILGILPITISVLDAAAISVGDLRISLLLVVKTAIIVAVLLWLASLVSHFTVDRVEHLEDLSPSMRVLAGKLIRIAIFAAALMIGLQSVGFDLTGLTVFSGAVGIGVGFGLQKVVSNFVSGIILLLDKSIKPGDVIEVGNTFGWITTLGGRYASVVTRDGREYLIPNEDLITHQVVNWSHSDTNVRLEVSFGVSYDSNPHDVRRIAIEAAQRPARALSSPKPVCHLIGFGDSSIDFVLRFWIADPNGGVVNIRSEVLLALWDALKENGVKIPYPHRNIHVREPIRVTVDRPGD